MRYAFQLVTVYDSQPPVINIAPEPLIIEATDFGGTRLAPARSCSRSPSALVGQLRPNARITLAAPELLPLGMTELTCTARDQGPNPQRWLGISRRRRCRRIIGARHAAADAAGAAEQGHSQHRQTCRWRGSDRRRGGRRPRGRAADDRQQRAGLFPLDRRTECGGAATDAPATPPTHRSKSPSKRLATNTAPTANAATANADSEAGRYPFDRE